MPSDDLSARWLSGELDSQAYFDEAKRRARLRVRRSQSPSWWERLLGRRQEVTDAG
jgi:hypothetical protein